MYGCPYELFWTLNPAKLDPWRRKHELEAEQQADIIDFLAWRIGLYDTQAMGVWWGHGNTYPQEPLGREKDDRIPPPGKGEEMSDGAKFMAFAVAHRQAIKKKRANQ